MSQEHQHPRLFAAHAIGSLLTDSPKSTSVQVREYFPPLLISRPEELTRGKELYKNFSSVLRDRGITRASILRDNTPYWLEDASYNPWEILGSVQFMDNYTAPIPKTLLPPSDHVETFINRVLQEPGVVPVDHQFSMLLDISNNNVLGAAHLGMVGTRYAARFSDRRAYPRLQFGDTLVTPETDLQTIGRLMKLWHDKLPKFEPYAHFGQNDSTGDTYYFWTHFFAATALASIDNLEAKALQHVFQRGTELMQFIKGNVASNGIVVTRRYEVSHLGRDVGLALATSLPDLLRERAEELLAGQDRETVNNGRRTTAVEQFPRSGTVYFVDQNRNRGLVLEEDDTLRRFRRVRRWDGAPVYDYEHHGRPVGRAKGRRLLRSLQAPGDRAKIAELYGENPPDGRGFL